MPILRNIPNINAVALWRIQDECDSMDLGLLLEVVEDENEDGLVPETEDLFCDYGLITETIE